MSIEIKVPELPESVADAVIAHWYKAVGDFIAEDENLLDLETDKVVLEVPAIHGGVVTEIKFKTGDTVKPGQLLAIIDETAVANQAAKVEHAATDKAAKKVSLAMSPSVRKLVAEYNINPADITPSGKHGRILKQDIEVWLQQQQTTTADTEQQEEAASTENNDATVFRPPVSGERLERRVPMTRLRARIAERLVQAQHNAAILTTFNEVNMQPVIDIRQRYKQNFEKKFNVRLGFMSFFIHACVEALKRFPEINASIDGNDVVYHGYYDIGVAVSGPKGLVVPVLRDADLLSIAQIEQSIADFASRAKDNALKIEEITGGTFTLSNGGVFGSMLSTPILNPPQSAILGMHNIAQRAMVVDNEIVALPVMYLALSYDHRLIDGSSAVQFLVTVKQLLEDPSRMLLGI